MNDLKDERVDLKPLFEKIVSHISAPKSEEGPFSMLVTTREYDPYLGRVLTGRIHSGVAKLNSAVKVLSHKGERVAMTLS